LEVIDEVRANANPSLEILGILPTAYDARSTKHDGRILEQIRKVGQQQGIRVYEPIHQAVAYKQASVAGTSVLEHAPDAPGIETYELIGQHIYAA
jgi:chromosome partitioning protein